MKDLATGRSVRSFYRVAKNNPPEDAEYQTPQDQGRKQPAGLSEEARRSWDALSCWDSEEGARRIGLQFPKSGHLIVRYDVPEGAGILWEQTIEPGHFDLRGDKEELKSYLSPDFQAEV